jgi:hypothetical protein
MERLGRRIELKAAQRSADMGRSIGLAVAAALVLMLAGPQRASACEGACGYGGGYGYAGYPAYPAPPAYAYAPAAYAAPPVYSYSYFGPAYGYAPAAHVTYYTTRINVFHGPRWDYSAAYYRSSSARYRGCPRARRPQARSACSGVGRYAGAGRAYRAYMYGPVIPVSRRW